MLGLLLEVVVAGPKRACERRLSALTRADEGDPVQMIGVKLHILTDGARYDLSERRARPG